MTVSMRHRLGLLTLAPLAACAALTGREPVTVDVVGADGAFLGGAIAPGLMALREGLRARAPALPPPASEPPPYPGRSSPIP